MPAWDGGIEVTAVHSHLLRANPATLYLHVGGHGDPVKMAEAIRSALALSKTPLDPPAAAAPPPAIDLDTTKLDDMGAKGSANGGVYQFGVPRCDQVAESGMAVVPPARLAVATAINFQPTRRRQGGDHGRFRGHREEVNPVIRTLRDNGIEVTAVHSHTLTEESRLIFLALLGQR